MSVTHRLADLAAGFAAALDHEKNHSGQGPIGLAVSGGGDSVAMMHLAARSLGQARFRVVTVDHGLRAAAAKEAALVAGQAASLGMPHDILSWTWDRQGNLQAAARAGRWAAIRGWCAQHGIAMVMMGHTADDQLETLLLRLARGSGVDGLGAMGRADLRDGLRICRPLLDISRDDLRDWLRVEDIAWCDDPSNEDPRFDRVRVRQMFGQLQALGLTRKRLLQTVDHMQAARLSLQKAAQDFARIHVRQEAGDLIFRPPALNLAREDAPRRVCAAALSWVGAQAYRPRFDSLLAAARRVSSGHQVTLGGCILSPLPDGQGARLTREAAATRPVTRSSAGAVDETGVIWDRRWFLDGPLTAGLTFRALGEGLVQCANWRAAGLPRTSLMASPSVWRDDTLIAAPVAGVGNGWSARIVADFHSTAFAIED
ncbi:tRNA lysidine(34) synthetase TilS [Yoonia sp.]|uniref:tRNA lysidine(34) synthetase TilS n=1 Tax=Yoonia sp. TaxID=2212373 RepID=UPI0019DAD830|nr:tRNA lysidine(34) synthetase TilS [Yoonia sp.]MBE0413503.1 tRNA lysidine(34) synthetase TilS [Yoonia sp.]